MVRFRQIPARFRASAVREARPLRLPRGVSGGSRRRCAAAPPQSWRCLLGVQQRPWVLVPAASNVADSAASGPATLCTQAVTVRVWPCRQTGVGYPQLSAIIECADAAHGARCTRRTNRPKTPPPPPQPLPPPQPHASPLLPPLLSSGVGGHIVADGGITCPGDAAKVSHACRHMHPRL